MEQFWSIYGHCVRPHDMKGHSDYHLFKEGIKPMWEVSGADICRTGREPIADEFPRSPGVPAKRRRVRERSAFAGLTEVVDGQLIC